MPKFCGTYEKIRTLNDIPAEWPVTAKSGEDVKDSVFCCIKGHTYDSHKDAKAVLDRGARLLVTERPLGFSREITVPSSRAAFSVLTARHYGEPARFMRVIGVTGTNGKTTTAHMLHFLLEASGRRAGLIGTNGVRFLGRTLPSVGTTPEPPLLYKSIKAMREAGVTDLVMEVSSQALDQERCAGLFFEAGVFLGLTPEHLDYHREMESYFAAKKRLFSQSGKAIINGADPYGKRLLEDFPGAVVFYPPQARSLKIGKSTALWRGKELVVPFTGEFSLTDAVAAAETACSLGLSPETVRAAFPGCPPVSGRGELLYKGEERLILRDYAHTPDALGKMLSVLRKIHFGRIIVLFGCGGDRDRRKRPLMGKLAVESADRVILTDDNPRGEAPEEILRDILAGIPQKDRVTVVRDRHAAIRKAVRELQEGDLLLLAGKGHETVQIFGDRTVPFDEKTIVKEILESENIPWKR